MSSIRHIFSFVPACLSGSTRPLLLANLVAVLVGGASSPALADERTINAIGHGVESCKAWLEARKDGYSAGYGDWLLGYLTGVNLWGPTGAEICCAIKMPGDDRMGRQVLYCISKG